MESSCPWKTKEYTRDIIGLHEEINDFYSFVKPRPQEILFRHEVVDRVRNIVLQVWPGAKVQLFGSVKTELFLPTSDIDIVVYGEWQSLPPVFTLESVLQRTNIAEPDSIRVIDKARVPIVKFVDKLLGIAVDISFNSSSGMKSANVTLHYIRQFPQILPKLVVIIKQFLFQRDLNETFMGGLGSYTITLMVTSFLQLHPRRQATKSDANLGVLLLEFFELYGRLFNHQRTGIQVHDGGKYFPKRSWYNRVTPDLLCIVDPTDYGNNVAKSSSNYLSVKLAFEHAYLILGRGVLGDDSFAQKEETLLQQIISLDSEMVEQRDSTMTKWCKKNFVPGFHKSGPRSTRGTDSLPGPSSKSFIT